MPSSSSRVLIYSTNQYSFGLVLGPVRFFGLQCFSTALVAGIALECWAVYISMLVLWAALGFLHYTLCFMAYNDLVLVLECRALL